MKELILKARRAIRFLFYKDLSIDNQMKISEILNDDENSTKLASPIFFMRRPLNFKIHFSEILSCSSKSFMALDSSEFISFEYPTISVNITAANLRLFSFIICAQSTQTLKK